jgi:hypothetical protein
MPATPAPVPARPAPQGYAPTGPQGFPAQNSAFQAQPAQAFPPGALPPAYVSPPAGFPATAAPYGQKKFPVLLVSLIGGGVLVLAITTVVLIIALLRPTTPAPGPASPAAPKLPGPGPDMVYLADNPTIVISIRWKDLVQSSAFRELAKEYPGLSEMQTSAKKGLGIESEDMVSMLGGLQPDSKDSLKQVNVVAIRLGKPYTAEEILKNRGWEEKDRETIKDGDRTIFQSKIGKKAAICLLEKDLLLEGDSAETLKNVLARGDEPKLSDSLRTAISNVDFSSTVAVASDLAALPKGRGLPYPFDFFDQGSVESGGLELRMGTELSAKGNLSFKNSADAETAKKSFEELKSLFGASKVVAGIPSVKKIVDKLEVSINGSRLTLSATNLDADWIKDKEITAKIQPLSQQFALGAMMIKPPPNQELMLKERGNCPDNESKKYMIELQANQTYFIRIMSFNPEFDPSLKLFDANKKLVAEAKTMFDMSQIIYRANLSGEFQIECGIARGRTKGGDFVLQVTLLKLEKK